MPDHEPIKGVAQGPGNRRAHRRNCRNRTIRPIGQTGIVDSRTFMHSFRALALAVALAVIGPASAWTQTTTTGAGHGPSGGTGGGISLIQNTASASSSNGTSWSVTFGSRTTTADGVLITFSSCNNASCTTQATSTPINSVTVDSNTCAEVPGTFVSGPVGAPNPAVQDVWLCSNITGSTGVVTVNSSVTQYYGGIAVSEWRCPTSHCSVDAGLGNTNGANGAGTLACTTKGNTSTSGDLIYSAALVLGTGTIAASGSAAAINQNYTVASRMDAYQVAGASGSSYSDSFAIAGPSPQGNFCSIAAIKP
jgi:hypothetical protein